MNEFELKAEQFLKEKGFHKVGEAWWYKSEVDNREYGYNENGFSELKRLLAEFADMKVREFNSGLEKLLKGLPSNSRKNIKLIPK